MSTIELTDVDGDALSVISRGESTWITCTSGTDEVTVGPFPTHLARTVLERGLAAENSTVTALVAHPSARDEPLSQSDRDRAWEVFTRVLAQGSARQALDRALDTALTSSAGGQDAIALSEELRRADLPDATADRLADHLVSLGYRRP